MNNYSRNGILFNKPSILTVRFVKNINYSNIQHCAMELDCSFSKMNLYTKYAYLSDYVYDSNPIHLFRDKGECLNQDKPLETVFSGIAEYQIRHKPKSFIFSGKHFGVLHVKKLRPVDILAGFLFIYKELWFTQGVQEHMMN